MKRPRWYRKPLYGLFVIARNCLPILPLEISRALGSGLGWMAYACLPRVRTQALRHLHASLGEMLMPRDERRVIRRMFQHLGMNAIEWLICPRLQPGQLQQLIHCDAQLVQQLRDTLARESGVILLSAHLGNWELLAAYFGVLGFPGGVVARRLRYPEYETWLIQMRRAHGVETFLRDTSWRELVRRLKARECIGIMPDQDLDSVDGIFVDFFGRPAYTATGPTLLAMHTGAQVRPTFIVREQGRFRIVMQDPIPLASTGDRARDIHCMTQAWTAAIEAMIRQYPEQWVWMHPRWKTQPTDRAT